MKRLRLFIGLLTFTIGVCIAPPKPSDNRPIIQHAADYGISLNRYSVTRCPLEDMQRPDVSPEKISLPNAKLSPWQLLLSLDGQDITKFDEKSQVKIKKAINSLVRKQSYWEYNWAKPRLFSKMSDEHGQSRYVLIVEWPLSTIPGEATIYAHIFDIEGKLLGTSEFTTGNRKVPVETGVKYMQEIGREILVISMVSVWGGGDDGKQYYALVGGKILLVRLEDACGNLKQNG